MCPTQSQVPWKIVYGSPYNEELGSVLDILLSEFCFFFFLIYKNLFCKQKLCYGYDFQVPHKMVHFALLSLLRHWLFNPLIPVNATYDFPQIINVLPYEYYQSVFDFKHKKFLSNFCSSEYVLV